MASNRINQPFVSAIWHYLAFLKRLKKNQKSRSAGFRFFRIMEQAFDETFKSPGDGFLGGHTRTHFVSVYFSKIQKNN